MSMQTSAQAPTAPHTIMGWPSILTIQTKSPDCKMLGWSRLVFPFILYCAMLHFRSIPLTIALPSRRISFRIASLLISTSLFVALELPLLPFDILIGILEYPSFSFHDRRVWGFQSP